MENPYGNLSGLYTPTLSNNSEALLYLISPTRFSDQWRRPNVYRFDGHMLQTAERIVDASVDAMNAANIYSMVRDPNILSCSMPSSIPTIKTDMQQFAYYWTFVLMVNNEKRGISPNSIESGNANNRCIYYGYCLDEPINFSMGTNTVNPNCAMVILHKTLVQQHKIIRPNGDLEYKTNTAADVDVVPGRTTSLLSQSIQENKNLYMMRPQDLAENVSVSGDGTSFITLADYNSIGNSDPICVNTRLNTPQYNLFNVLNAVSETKQTFKLNQFSGPMSREIDLPVDSVSELIHQNLQDPTGIVETVGLSPTMFLTMADVMARYSPKIVPIKVPQAVMYGQVDQSGISINSSMCAFLTTVIPSVLSNYAIASLAFMYNSFGDRSHMGGLRVEHIETLIPMTPEEKTMRGLSVIKVLKEEIFPILYMNRGDFNLIANCSCGGITTVNLNFECDSKHDGNYEVPTMLGGLNSTLVGDFNTTEANGTQLGNLFGVLTDTPIQYPASLTNEFNTQKINNTQPTNQSFDPSIPQLDIRL